MNYLAFLEVKIIKKRIIFFLVLFCIGFFCLPLYSSNSDRVIRESIEKSMNKLLNNPKLLNMKIGEIHVKSDNVVVKRVDVKLKEAVFDHLNIDDGIMIFDSLVIDKNMLLKKNRIKIISSKKIDIKVEISENSLNRYIKAKSRKIKVRNPKIRFRHRRIYLSGTFSWKLGRISFRSYGKFKVKDNKIYFNILNFKINGINLPSYLIRKTIRQVNPILDMKKFPFETDLKYIEIKDKKMVISSLDN